MRRALGVAMVLAAMVLVVVAAEVARADPPRALPDEQVSRFQERLRWVVERRGRAEVGPVEGLQADDWSALRSELRGYAGTVQVELRTFAGRDGPARALVYAHARLRDQLRAGRRLVAGTLDRDATANAWVEVRGHRVAIARARAAAPLRGDELTSDVREAVDVLWRVARAEQARPVWTSVLQEDGSLVVGVDQDVAPTIRGLAGSLAEAGLQPRTAVRRAADERLGLHAWRSPSRDRLEAALVDRVYQARRGLLDVLSTAR